MTFLKDVLNFFWREKGWAVLFFVLAAVIAAIFMQPGKLSEKRRSQAIEQLHQAEAKLKEEIKAKGGMQGFLADKPRLVKIFSIFSSVLMVILIIGTILDFFWFTRPQWRSRLSSGTDPPEARGWGLSTVFKVALLFVIATLGMSLLLSFLKSSVFRSVSANFYVLIHTTFSDLFIIAIVVAFIRCAGGSWKDLGFRRLKPWKDFWIGIVGYIGILPLFVVILVALVAIVQLFSYEPPPHPLVEIFLEEEKRAPWLIVYSIFLACIAGPILEEIFFRGFLYPALKKRWGMNAALVLSAALFSSIHQNVFAFLPVFVLGLVLGYLYEERGNLMPSIFLHVIHNSIFISYFFLAQQMLKGNL